MCLARSHTGNSDYIKTTHPSRTLEQSGCEAGKAGAAPTDSIMASPEDIHQGRLAAGTPQARRSSGSTLLWCKEGRVCDEGHLECGRFQTRDVGGQGEQGGAAHGGGPRARRRSAHVTGADVVLARSLRGRARTALVGFVAIGSWLGCSQATEWRFLLVLVPWHCEEPARCAVWTRGKKRARFAGPTSPQHCGPGCTCTDAAVRAWRQVAWHPSNLDEPRLSHNLPILSCDLSPTDPTRLATGGADNAARIWSVSGRRHR